ncbi:MAG: GDP-mannose 4,6-dehydratase [Clostridia bacterium]|nr:GDP-mannose 4,6-dehydratase [Clostridia bacterium]MDD4047712.1 GDP-mannose 4,6-dehydratase [Clostridia bacterium]
MKILITGISGFVGSHLAEYALKQENVEVYGTIRKRSPLENIKHILHKINLVECDLRDPFSVNKTISEVRPEKIFHLAAQSFVPTSWKAPGETLTTNILGQLNIFEAVRQEGLATRIQVACSSEEYGKVYTDEVPITEENPLRPLSPYGVSKVTQDFLAYQYYASYGMFVVRTRAFNHTGPRRGKEFVTSNFAMQVAEIEKGLRKPVLYTGNLEALRDFTDVRDMVKGYWLSLEKGDPGEVYVLASGKAYAIREVLEILLNLTTVKITLQQDPTRLRPSDVPILHGDANKFKNKTGWKAEIPFEKTVEDLLNYWRLKIDDRW